MTGIRSKLVMAGVAALALTACGSSPPPPPPPPVTLHGVFIDYSPTNSGFDRASCASAETGLWQISAEADGATTIADLTFGNAGAGYEAAVKVWECSAKWSATVPRSAAGYTITLDPSTGSSSSVKVSAPYNGSSVTLDDGGTLNDGDGGGLELTPPANVALASAALSQAAVARNAAIAAAKAAAARKAAAKAAAARAAKIAAEDTPISATKWGEVIRNPDAYVGDIFTILGTVAEYNADSNTFATVENAALVATDANGNDFVVECDAYKLGNVQPGQTFTAKVTVVGVVQAQNTVYGGTGEVPDFDASTFTVTG
jgi:hypothetical protein